MGPIMKLRFKALEGSQRFSAPRPSTSPGATGAENNEVGHDPHAQETHGGPESGEDPSGSKRPS